MTESGLTLAIIFECMSWKVLFKISFAYNRNPINSLHVLLYWHCMLYHQSMFKHICDVFFMIRPRQHCSKVMCICIRFYHNALYILHTSIENDKIILKWQFKFAHIDNIIPSKSETKISSTKLQSAKNVQCLTVIVQELHQLTNVPRQLQHQIYHFVNDCPQIANIQLAIYTWIR